MRFHPKLSRSLSRLPHTLSLREPLLRQKAQANPLTRHFHALYHSKGVRKCVLSFVLLPCDCAHSERPCYRRSCYPRLPLRSQNRRAPSCPTMLPCSPPA